MKYQALALAVLATVSGAAASPAHAHAHAHMHHHHHQQQGPAKIKRVAEPVADGHGAVATVYYMGKTQLSAFEVIEGIANGTFVWAEPPPVSVAASASVAIKAPVVVSTSTSSSTPVPSSTSSSTPSSTPASSSAPAPSSTPAPKPTPEVKLAPAPAPKSAVLSGGAGVTADFPDGQIDCSDFPDEYGAVAVPYLNLGGWIGVQQPANILAAAFDDIKTLIGGQCPGGQCCREGTFCSYACPAGFQKSQWPTAQGLTGQSIGGIQCKNGKLWLTNKSLSSKLCIPGASEVEVTVKNTMSEQASICRTDYPGTESETVPLSSQPGTTEKLTCPAASNYYTWEGKSTSAQYYVNPKGVGVQEACQWDKAGSGRGNYAPMNLGVGYKDGRAWLSIFQNAPSTYDKLDFTVELVGDNGGFDNLSGRCRYKDGQYCSGDNYETCSSDGCTVSAASGTITYVLSA